MYLERRIKVIYYRKQVIQYHQCSFYYQTLFVARLTKRASVVQGIFQDGFERRAVTQTRSAFRKMPRVPSALSWRVAPQSPGDKTSPSK